MCIFDLQIVFYSFRFLIMMMILDKVSFNVNVKCWRSEISDWSCSFLKNRPNTPLCNLLFICYVTIHPFETDTHLPVECFCLQWYTFFNQNLHYGISSHFVADYRNQWNLYILFTKIQWVKFMTIKNFHHPYFKIYHFLSGPP